MAVSIVLAWYHSEPHWPKTLVGLEDNLSAIQEIVISCDHEEPIAESVVADLEDLGRPYSILYQEHRGFGLSRSTNRGVLAASGPIVLKLDDDIIFPIGVIAQMEEQAARGLVIRALMHDENSMKMEIPELLVKDGFYTLFRGGNLMFYKEDFIAVGGMNEEMTELGLQDYEFGVRWARRFGIPGIKLVGECYHMDNCNRSPVPDSGGSSVRILKQQLAELLGVDVSKLVLKVKR